MLKKSAKALCVSAAIAVGLGGLMASTTTEATTIKHVVRYHGCERIDNTYRLRPFIYYRHGRPHREFHYVHVGHHVTYRC